MKIERKLLTALVTLMMGIFLFAMPVRADGNVRAASVAASDITRYVNDRYTNSWEEYYYNEETGDYEDAVWERINCWPRDAEVTVTMTDGTVSEGSGDDVNRRLENEYGLHLYWESDEKPDALWGVGEHTATLYVGDYSDSDVSSDFTVTLLELPDAVMTVPDMTVYDTHIAEWSEYFDQDAGDWVDPGVLWRIDCHPNEITVTFEGREYSGQVHEVAGALMRNENMENVDWNWESDQVYGEPVGDEIHATFALGFLRAEYTVHVIPDPVESLTVGPITRMLGDNMNRMRGWSDAEGIFHDEYWERIDCWPGDSAITAVVGGKTYESFGTDDLWAALEEDGYSFELWWESDENPGNVWGAGEHTATFYLGDFPAEYTVTVRENPIISVSVPDFSVYDYDKNEMWGYYDENDNYVYETWYRINADPYRVDATVETTEGSFTGKVYEIEEWLRETFDYDFECFWDTDETPLDPWIAGNTYTAALHIGGVDGSYRVTVLETPDAVLTVDDFVRFPYQLTSWTEYYDEENDTWIEPEENWRINCHPDRITVTVNGHTYSGDVFDVITALEENENIIINDWSWDTDQVYGEPVGETINATLQLGFMTADYTVHVSDVSFESLEVPDITRYDTDRFEAIGYRHDESTGEEREVLWNQLDCWPRDASCKLILTNGDVYEGSIDRIVDRLTEDGYSDFDYYWTCDESPDNIWAEGNHQAAFHIGNVSCEYTVTVLKNPITKIIVPNITRYDIEREEMDGYVSPWGAVTDETWYRINANPATEAITVETTAGTFTGELGEIGSWLRETFGVDFDMHWDSDESPYEPWTAGNTYTATQYIGGLGGDYQVTVVETPFNDIELSVDNLERLSTDLADWRDYYDEELDTWVDPGEKWRIDCWPERITVTVDGQVYSGSVGEVVEALNENGIFIHDVYWSSDQVYGEPVTGPLHATLHFGFISADYLVTVGHQALAPPPWPLDVVYSGGMQALAEAGTASAGTMYYAVGSGDTAPAPEAFTTEIPKAKEPGVYPIWYMLKDEAGGMILSPNCAGRAKVLFTDVKSKSAWYFSTVYWALEKGVTSGYGEGTFQPSAQLTRAQTVTFLYKLAGQPDVGTYPEISFKDVAKKDWYYKAVRWAVGEGITKGYGEGTFQPNVSCNRAMVVTFLMHFAELNGTYVAPKEHASFKDVKSNDWFAPAVDWAVASGVTSGYGEGTFQPMYTCNRAMMVTFLKKTAELG